MLPRDLRTEHFAAYPPHARNLAVAHLEALRRLPLSFLPSLLREAIDYDFKFPAERDGLNKELTALASLSQAQTDDWFHAFSQLSLPPKIASFDWINKPAQFLEQESAYLWSTHQLDAFRQAATDYGSRLQSATPSPPLPARRLGIAVIGQGLSSYDGPLFRNLRAHGTYFDQVKPDEGLAELLKTVADRAIAHPAPYGHWYIDGGQEANHNAQLTCVSYQRLEPLRLALLKYIQSETGRPGMGPEELRTKLAQLVPSDLVGLCQGGWLSLLYAARFPTKVRKLVLAGAPIDIAAGQSALSALADASPLALFHELVKLGDGRVLGQKVLKFWGSETIGTHAIHQLLQTPEPIGSPAFAELEAIFRDWNAWTVDLPGTYYFEVIEKLYKSEGGRVGEGTRSRRMP